MSGASSNITAAQQSKSPEYRSVAEFVRSSADQFGVTRFTLDGNRGEKRAQLCRILPGVADTIAPPPPGTLDASKAGSSPGVIAAAAGGRMECTEIAMEAKDLFAAMQSLNFFCQLPQDPTKTHILCERIPQ